MTSCWEKRRWQEVTTELNPEEQENRYVTGCQKGAVRVERWCSFKGFQLEHIYHLERGQGAAGRVDAGL